MRKFSVTFLFCKGANFFELRAECPLRHLPSKCCSPNLPQKSNTCNNDVLLYKLSSQMSVCVGFKNKTNDLRFWHIFAFNMHRSSKGGQQKLEQYFKPPKRRRGRPPKKNKSPPLPAAELEEKTSKQVQQYFPRPKNTW